MLSKKAQNALNGWIDAAGPVVDKLYGKSDADWPEVRAQYMCGLEKIFPGIEGVSYTTSMLGDTPVMISGANEMVGSRVVLYIHGGGYVHGGLEAYRGLTGRFAKSLRATVYTPDYRQAPEFTFPTPIDDVFAAYCDLLNRGIRPKDLVLVGDSAGGAMVVTLMRKARDAGIPLPAAGVAISPWADLAHSGLSAATRDGIDPICNVDFLKKLARCFLAEELPTHPDASPVYANVQGLAPILIQVGENEVMLNDATRLASNLGEARVRTTLEVWPGMFHVWHLLAGILPEADQAMSSAIHFIENAFTQGKLDVN